MSTSTSIANTPHDPVAPETVTQVAIPSCASRDGRDAHDRNGARSPLEDWPLYVVVFVGGCLGTALRYALSLALPRPLADEGFLGAFHTATFVANMCACFIYSWLTMMLAQSVWISKRTRSLMSHGIGMGMCGGFSTLSALAVEELLAARGGNVLGALGYELVSFVCGVAVVFGGVKLALAMTAKRQSAQVRETVQRQTTVEEADAAAEAFLAAHPADPAPIHVRTRPWVAPEIPSEVVVPAEGKRDAAAETSTPLVADAGAAAEPEAGSEPEFEAEPDTDEIPAVERRTTAEENESNADAPAAESPSAASPVADEEDAATAEPSAGIAAEPAPVVIPQVVDDPDGDAPSFDRIVHVVNHQRGEAV
ncbi:camphor resistance protein CrcB [Bifidobacterium sp. DSM 109958]|uniref:Fluoride-specific ion channel FluC n=1 Tax=Bifidobacterium moraviense TaxID=2675323 RepID=A0A7Y0F258_9BIFI|nr:CrcB family protein [Bifidobacterium sp. DSM 109958]NMN00660.1 camphor resistance protein CrcB [Bifidobacterium sp. DSM 109958]